MASGISHITLWKPLKMLSILVIVCAVFAPLAVTSTAYAAPVTSTVIQETLGLGAPLIYRNHVTNILYANLKRPGR